MQITAKVCRELAGLPLVRARAVEADGKRQLREYDAVLQFEIPRTDTLYRRR